MTLSRIWTVVSTNWLHDQIAKNIQQKVSRRLRILDTSFTFDRTVNTYKEGYQRNHIPQSLHFDLFKCVDSKPWLPLGLPNIDCFTDYVQSLGVWSDTHLVAYDRYGPLSAYKTWWLFRVHGHRNISVLDGGLAKWIADGYEVTTNEPIVERSDFIAKIDKNLLRTYEDMLENIKSKREQVVDARAKDEHSVVEVEKGGGFIPGAKHLNFGDLFSEAGTIKSDKDLKLLFDSAGVDLGSPMVVSCYRGLAACGVAAAANILGKENVPIYYGSWREYSYRALEDLKGNVKT